MSDRKPAEAALPSETGVAPAAALRKLPSDDLLRMPLLDLRSVDIGRVEEIDPDVVVVATGACPMIPDDIPGIDKDRVVTAWDVLSGKAATTARNAMRLYRGESQ
mgnify:CR=1 FL=1